MDDVKDEGLCDDGSQDEPIRYPISCTNVPESFFDDEGAAAKHFEKFGSISKILLRPAKQSCIVEYEKREHAERAILNAGAYDGFMFDVTWSKNRKRPKVNDDPDWLPDLDVAAELAAMSAGGQKVLPRLQRQQKMELEKPSPILHSKRPPLKNNIAKKKVVPVETVPSIPQPANQPNRAIDRDELKQLVGRAWNTTEEKIKALEIRDRVVRAVLTTRHGAIQGCCPDMCPERERLVREFQRQVSSYEMGSSEGGRLDPRCAVKQYSRSSADQEEPLCYELRPVPVLQTTLLYLLHRIMDLGDETSLEDWFHFLWDRLRSIRKDITQQALCCKGSVSLVEACARFHAHCAARLVEEPPSSFDQRLNTENLLKCLQSLKYMYGDLRARGQPQGCVREPEFRAYVVLLNMHDSNFMWEVQHLDSEVQSSPEIRFAIKVFTALDNNNYFKFFKLVKETTYINACILLRYFSDVRARALTRMIKSYSPRGVSQFPANELMDLLGFESLNSMQLFLNHYGLQMTTDQDITYVVLNKNAFRDSNTPYAQERAINLIESKLKTSLGEVVYGDVLPPSPFESYTPHSSFEPSGFIKKSAILAEDQGYQAPKERAQEIANMLKPSSIPVRTSQVVSQDTFNNPPSKSSGLFPSQPRNIDFTFAKPEIPKGVFSQNTFNMNTSEPLKKLEKGDNNLFKKIDGDDLGNKFVFSKPAEAEPSKSLWVNNSASNLFSKGVSEIDSTARANLFGSKFDQISSTTLFANSAKPNAGNLFALSQPASIFGDKSNTGEVNTKIDVFKTQSSVATATFQNNIFNTAASSLFGNAVANIPYFDKNKALEEEMRQKAAEEAEKKLEEDRRAQEKIKEEILKQEELKRKIEEEKRILALAKQKAELEKKQAELAKKKAELERQEQEKKARDLEIRIEKQLHDIIPEITNEVVKELCYVIMEEEIDAFEALMVSAYNTTEDLLKEVCVEECEFGIHAAIRLNEIRLRIVSRAAGRLWRCQVLRSKRRRSLLHITPAWLPSRPPPIPPPTQSHAIQRMRDFHRGKLPNFKLPNPYKNYSINLFELVKKSLLKRSQELKSKSVSLNVYWKVVFSVPGQTESNKYISFFRSWFTDLFTDNQIDPHNNQIYLSENYWYKKFAASITKVTGCNTNNSDPPEFEAISGLNGLVIFCNTEYESITNLMKRINHIMVSKCDYECIPIVLLLVTQKNDEVVAIDSHLNQYKSHKFISDFKIIRPAKFDYENLSVSTKEALKWLSKIFLRSPTIESQLLSTYLDQCIGGELWYRFKLSLNSSLRQAFDNITTLTNLYNEAVGKAMEIVTVSDLCKYPVSPSEFQEYSSFTHVYPKTYEYISGNWKSNLPAIRDVISSFKMPQYMGEWPPSTYNEFQESLRKFVFKLNWFINPEKVVLRILSITKDDSPDYEFKENGDVSKYSWIEIMNVLVSEKIKETINCLGQKLPNSAYKPDLYSDDFIVVYKPRDLNNFRTSPWWYKSSNTKDISPVVEDYPDDMSELDVSNTKKRKLDSGDILDDSEIPDETWINTVLMGMDETIQQTSQCHKMFTDLEKSLEIEKQKQIEFKELLRSALGEDWNPDETMEL